MEKETARRLRISQSLIGNTRRLGYREYHHKPGQKEKDNCRQQKIIETLNPKKFWRYDAVNKTFQDIIGHRNG